MVPGLPAPSQLPFDQRTRPFSQKQYRRIADHPPGTHGKQLASGFPHQDPRHPSIEPLPQATANIPKSPVQFGTAHSAAERIVFFSMRTKWQVSAFFMGAVLACAPALVWSQSPSPSQDSGAKQDMKDAGQQTKDAAKDAGHSVKQGTKKAYHKTKHGTKKAWHKTKDTTTGAVNGAKEGAKQPE
jgi:hypothetical protein